MVYISFNLAKYGPICEKTYLQKLLTKNRQTPAPYPQKLMTLSNPSSDIVTTFGLFLIVWLPLVPICVIFNAAKKNLCFWPKTVPERKILFLAKNKYVKMFYIWVNLQLFILVTFTGEQSKRVSRNIGGILLRMALL